MFCLIFPQHKIQYVLVSRAHYTCMAICVPGVDSIDAMR